MRSVRLSIRTVALAVALFASAISASAFWAPTHHKRDVRAEVTAIDQQWRDAQLSNDAAMLDKLLSEDYIGITSGGAVVTKEQQLDRVRKRMTQFVKLDITDIKIKLVRNVVAIVTSSAEVEGTSDGHKIHGTFRSTRVYQRLPNGAWKITSFEATPIRPQGHMESAPQS